MKELVNNENAIYRLYERGENEKLERRYVAVFDRVDDAINYIKSKRKNEGDVVTEISYCANLERGDESLLVRLVYATSFMSRSYFNELNENISADTMWIEPRTETLVEVDIQFESFRNEIGNYD